MARKRIGELLLERGAISKTQLEAGLAAQKRTRQRLGVTLISQGVLTEVQLAQVLAQSLNLGTVDLTQVQVEWAAVHMLRDRFCETHELFPFAIDGKGTKEKKLLVAMSDPLNQPAIEEIEFTTGLPVAPYVSTHSQVRGAILRYYHKASPAEAAARARPPAPIPPQPDDEPPVMMGEEIISSANPMPPQPGKKTSTSMSRDLDFLFGARPDEETDVEKLERRFWALLRLLQRKGVMTRDEFLAEVDREG
ncbi:MAG: general secretion pathway protein GspE [Archangium sp.]|nr:general secretion pathway protein GspE [Archangium sp.]